MLHGAASCPAGLLALSQWRDKVPGCLQGSAPPVGGGFQLPASSYALPRISTAAPHPPLLSKALFEELSGIRQHGEVGA